MEPPGPPAAREMRYYLELTAPGELRPAPSPDPTVQLSLEEPPDVVLSRLLYESIGRDWRWVDRLDWPDEEWAAYLSKPGIETWVLRCQEQAAGYFELALRGEEAEIVYFGVMPAFIGRGLGGYLLTEAVRRAWASGARRVWLHTCTRDHPHALANYQARGFRIFRTEPL